MIPDDARGADLPNRVQLNDVFTHELPAAKRRNSPLAVLYVDLDRFKHINDSLGHAAGDRLLKSVARRLLQGVRTSDTVCRLGGDKFAIVLSELAHAEDAAVCAEKILESLRAPIVIDARELHVSSSIGIAIFPGDGIELEALLKNADSAMYEAKLLGRDNYQFYRRGSNPGAHEFQHLDTGPPRYAIERTDAADASVVGAVIQMGETRKMDGTRAERNRIPSD